MNHDQDRLDDFPTLKAWGEQLVRSGEERSRSRRLLRRLGVPLAAVALAGGATGLAIAGGVGSADDQLLVPVHCDEQRNVVEPGDEIRAWAEQAYEAREGQGLPRVPGQLVCDDAPVFSPEDGDDRPASESANSAGD